VKRSLTLIALFITVSVMFATLSGCGEPGPEPGPPAPKTGTVAGKVTDKNGGAALATVKITAGNKETYSADDGTYNLAEVPTGEQVLKAKTTGYKDYSKTITVTAGQTTTQNIDMEAIGPAIIKGLDRIRATVNWHAWGEHPTEQQGPVVVLDFLTEDNKLISFADVPLTVNIKLWTMNADGTKGRQVFPPTPEEGKYSPNKSDQVKSINTSVLRVPRSKISVVNTDPNEGVLEVEVITPLQGTKRDTVLHVPLFPPAP